MAKGIESKCGDTERPTIRRDVPKRGKNVFEHEAELVLILTARILEIKVSVVKGLAPG